MADEQQGQQQGFIQIRLDGSYGPGPMAELTITTKTETGGETSVQFTIPYLLIDMKRLQYMSDINLIVGYGVKKQPEARLAGLRELGLG
jgi:hypothetical protein